MIRMHEVTFCTASRVDADYVNSRLREADKKEIIASGSVVKGAVWESVCLSEYAWTGLIDGEPAMVFGIDHGTLSPEAEIWALGTDKCTAVPREMLYYGRQKIAELLEYWPVLTNYCHADNALALRWLKHLGFEISAPEPTGVHGEKFCKITIRKRG